MILKKKNPKLDSNLILHILLFLPSLSFWKFLKILILICIFCCFCHIFFFASRSTKIYFLHEFNKLFYDKLFSKNLGMPAALLTHGFSHLDESQLFFLQKCFLLWFLNPLDFFQSCQKVSNISPMIFSYFYIFSIQFCMDLEVFKLIQTICITENTYIFLIIWITI